jgi:hypothetical protein
VYFWKEKLTDVDTNLRILSTRGEQPINTKCDENKHYFCTTRPYIAVIKCLRMCGDKEITLIKGTFSLPAIHFHNFIYSSRSAIGCSSAYVRPRRWSVQIIVDFLSWKNECFFKLNMLSSWPVLYINADVPVLQQLWLQLLTQNNCWQVLRNCNIILFNPYPTNVVYIWSS